MKRIIAIIGALCAMTAYSYGQQADEIGLGLGISTYMGCIGNKVPNKNTYFNNLAASMVHESGQVYYAHSFNPRFSVKLSFSGAEIAGADSKANSSQIFDDGWYRQYRNLSFQSRILQLSATGQLNILKYTPGSMKHRWTPYVTAGVSIFDFDPRAWYNGVLYRLQPLGTEGEGLPEYPDRKKYDLVQPSIPVGFGCKFNINEAFTVGIEFTHNATFTGYLDDVSKTYVSEQDFVSYYGEAKGQLIYALSRRSVEIDPEGHYASITAPGEPRGNPSMKDSYQFAMVTMAYTISGATRREHNGFSHRRVRRYRRIFR